MRPLPKLGFVGTFKRPLATGRRDVRGGSVYQRAMLSRPSSISRSGLAKQGIASGGPQTLRIPPRSLHPIITEARDSRYMAIGGSTPRPPPATGSGLDAFCHWAGLVQVLCSVDGRVHASVRDARKALT